MIFSLPIVVKRLSSDDFFFVQVNCLNSTASLLHPDVAELCRYYWQEKLAQLFLYVRFNFVRSLSFSSVCLKFCSVKFSPLADKRI